MNENLIYNRPMYYKEKIEDYKKFCERISLIKSISNPKPPQDYPFLRYRLKKRVMEKEKQENINYNIDLLLRKYKSMYKNHNIYHPSNIKFQPHPSSLKFSTGKQEYYELYNNNKYLGNKIKKIQNSIGSYNCQKSLDHYNHMKKIGNKIKENSIYSKQLLNLVSPFTYEKRLHRMMEESNKNKINKRYFGNKTTRRPKTGVKFYNTNDKFYHDYLDKKTYKFKLDDYCYNTANSNYPNEKEDNYNYYNNYKKIMIEREDGNEYH